MVIVLRLMVNNRKEKLRDSTAADARAMAIDGPPNRTKPDPWFDVTAPVDGLRDYFFIKF